MTTYRNIALSGQTRIPGRDCNHKHSTPESALACEQPRDLSRGVIAVDEDGERQVRDDEWHVNQHAHAPVRTYKLEFRCNNENGATNTTEDTCAHCGLIRLTEYNQRTKRTVISAWLETVAACKVDLAAKR